MKTSAEAVAEMRRQNPKMKAVAIAAALGLSRQRISQILSEAGLPTKVLAGYRYDTPEYACWTQMLQRCYNDKHVSWADYGGRGIKVCDKWRTSFSAFIEDMGDRPSPRHSIDRENNDLGYSPDNCRWATKAEQSANRRPWRNTGRSKNRKVNVGANNGKMGAKPKLTPQHLNSILAHLNGMGVKKMTVLELSKSFKVKPPTIYRYFSLDKSGKKPVYIRKAGT